MKATKSQINKISKDVWKRGHGGKKELCGLVPCQQTELSRLFSSGKISEWKLNRLIYLCN